MEGSGLAVGRGHLRGRLKVALQVTDPLLRDALVTWLDTVPGYVVAGAVSTGPALTRLCALRAPDVAVLQLGAADAGELSLITDLRELRPSPYVIGLHSAVEPARSSRAGCSGYTVPARTGSSAASSARQPCVPRWARHGSNARRRHEPPA
jgi:DNA-binding NarL/FixJ family response regulator